VGVWHCSRKPKKAVPASKRSDSTAELRKVLSSRKKEELVNFLLELAQADRGVLRQLAAQFEVAPAPDELVAATRQAIIDATDFDERDINSNFDYDYEAYREVKGNLGRLIDSGQLQPAMQLSLELMKKGSYQVEMSDEGIMSDDIEDCLNVVIKSLRKCGLHADELIAWCSAMRVNDRVGSIASEQLESLRKHLQAAAKQ
jgi:hypothetical protein